MIYVIRKCFYQFELIEVEEDMKSDVAFLKEYEDRVIVCGSDLQAIARIFEGLIKDLHEKKGVTRFIPDKK